MMVFIHLLSKRKPIAASGEGQKIKGSPPPFPDTNSCAECRTKTRSLLKGVVESISCQSFFVPRRNDKPRK
jgi:hypothetical protein